jgi:hypothetical protein
MLPRLGVPLEFPKEDAREKTWLARVSLPTMGVPALLRPGQFIRGVAEAVLELGLSSMRHHNMYASMLEASYISTVLTSNVNALAERLRVPTKGARCVGVRT